MSAFAQSNLSPFAADVEEGLAAEQKYISARYLHDELGHRLVEAIAMLPEYGLLRAEQRITRRHTVDLARLVGPLSLVADLSGGNCNAAGQVIRGLSELQPGLRFVPLDLSGAAFSFEHKLPVNWLETAIRLSRERPDSRPLLFMLLGNSMGDLDRTSQNAFLDSIRRVLHPGDSILFGADLLKGIDKMISCYDDAAGVISAFNKNVLARVNCELNGHFNLRQFGYEVRWNAFLRRVEMHLLSRKEQEVYIGALVRRFQFTCGESILTDCAYKFSEIELEDLAKNCGFQAGKTWIDVEWAFAEVLLTV